ncbi:extracellular solute-binding protein [Streptomyces asiaticus]
MSGTAHQGRLFVHAVVGRDHICRLPALGRRRQDVGREGPGHGCADQWQRPDPAVLRGRLSGARTSVPKTWEQAVANRKAARKAGKKAARKAGKIEYGYVACGQAVPNSQSITYDFMSVFYSYGGQWFANPGTDWTPTVDTEQAAAAAEMYKELLSLGPSSPNTVGQAKVTSIMQSGDGLQCHSVAAIAPSVQDPRASHVVGKMGTAAVPAGSTGRPAVPDGSWLLAVPVGLPSERQKRALHLL